MSTMTRLCDHTGVPDAHCRCDTCTAYFAENYRQAVSLPKARAAQLREQARQNFREADELRSLADQYDLAGCECEKAAWELDPS